jgi:hypothetical protein
MTEQHLLALCVAALTCNTTQNQRTRKNKGELMCCVCAYVVCRRALALLPHGHQVGPSWACGGGHLLHTVSQTRLAYLLRSLTEYPAEWSCRNDIILDLENHLKFDVGCCLDAIIMGYPVATAAISHHLTRSQTTSHHLRSSHTTPSHTIPSHTTPSHTTPSHTTPHHTTPHHTTPHHTTPHHTISDHTTPHHTT